MKKQLLIWVCACVLTACSGKLITTERPDPYAGMSQPQLSRMALRGDTEAQFRLSTSLCCGEGIQYDNKLAYRLMCYAAKNGHVEAQYTLGNLYANGLPLQYSGKNNTSFEIPSNPSKAYMWYSVAEQHKHKGAKKAKNQLSKGMDINQVNEAFRLRKNWQTMLCDEV